MITSFKVRRIQIVYLDNNLLENIIPLIFIVKQRLENWKFLKDFSFLSLVNRKYNLIICGITSIKD